jgi:WD40-like Beta Propeller Repeat
MYVRMYFRRSGRILGLLATATACGTLLFSAQPSSSANAFHEQVIGEIPAGTAFKAWIAAGDHVAWAGAQDGNWTVMLDGKKQGGTYREVEYLTLSPDGLHLHFFGKLNDGWAHVFDGSETARGYASVTAISVQPQGGSFAYGACARKNSCQLVVNDKPASDEYENISFPRYSDDGKHLGFCGTRQKGSHIVVDGRDAGPQVGYHDPNHWGFDKTGRLYAAVSSNFKWTYLIGDTMGPMFDVISPIAFSPDGQHYAYGGANVHPGFGKQKSDATVVLDGRPGQSYEGSGMADALTTVVLGEIQAAPKGVLVMLTAFFGVSGPAFSPDGKAAYAVRRGKGDVVAMLSEDAGPALDELLSPILFSSDAKHSAYIGARGDSFLEVRDNQPGKTFPIGARVGVVDWGVMSSDGSRFAYELVRGGVDYMNRATTRARRSVVLDSQPGREYNASSIGMLLFSGDQRHYLYPVARIDGKYDLVVADGTESKPYDEITDLHISSDGNSAIFLARDSSHLLRVTYPLQ